MNKICETVENKFSKNSFRKNNFIHTYTSLINRLNALKHTFLQRKFLRYKKSLIEASFPRLNNKLTNFFKNLKYLNKTNTLFKPVH